MMESFFHQFDSQASCAIKMHYGFKKISSIYEKEFLPLALELYTHHVSSSDLALLNSLLSFNNAGPSPSDAMGGANSSSFLSRDNNTQ